jgi:hypothetical protein
VSPPDQTSAIVDVGRHADIKLSGRCSRNTIPIRHGRGVLGLKGSLTVSTLIRRGFHPSLR